MKALKSFFIYLKGSSFITCMFLKNTCKIKLLSSLRNLLPHQTRNTDDTINTIAESVPDISVESKGIVSARHFLEVSNRAGWPLATRAKILDFGCGAGDMTKGLLELGYDAYGYDIINYITTENMDMVKRFSFFPESNKETGDHIIDWNKFTLPYPDNSFDAVFTSQVLEHIMNHKRVFQEFSRILKPTGCSINIFPPRCYPIEHHIRIPFGYTLHNKTYYFIMALMGCRNEYQMNRSAKDRAEINYNYVKNGLNYVPNSTLVALAKCYFSDAEINTQALHYLAKKPSFFWKWYLNIFYNSSCLVMGRKKEMPSTPSNECGNFI